VVPRPIGLFLVLFVLVACGDNDTAERTLESKLNARAAALSLALKTHNDQSAANNTGLVVQLAFGAEADLDLYVTDPLLETTYFANRQSKSGGSLGKDSRCDGGPLQIEEVKFKAPIHGRYRVGVDFPKRCKAGPRDFEERAAFTLSIFYNGQRKLLQSTVDYHFFELAVLEFDVNAMELKELDNGPSTN
jgi:hypothetical protein